MQACRKCEKAQRMPFLSWVQGSELSLGRLTSTKSSELLFTSSEFLRNSFESDNKCWVSLYPFWLVRWKFIAPCEFPGAVSVLCLPWEFSAFVATLGVNSLDLLLLQSVRTDEWRGLSSHLSVWCWPPGKGSSSGMDFVYCGTDKFSCRMSSFITSSTYQCRIKFAFLSWMDLKESLRNSSAYTNNKPKGNTVRAIQGLCEKHGSKYNETENDQKIANEYFYFMGSVGHRKMCHAVGVEVWKELCWESVIISWTSRVVILWGGLPHRKD